MARAGPRKTRKYSEAFKLTAVRMTKLPGIQVQPVLAYARGSAVTPRLFIREAKVVGLRPTSAAAPPAP